MLNTLRLPETSYVKLFITILNSCIICGSFHVIDGTANGTATRNGLIFYAIISNAFFLVQSFILVFPDERPVFLREINNGMYEASSYYLAKVTSEVPINIFLPTLNIIIIYWSVNLNTAHAYNFFYFWLTILMTNFATGAYALCMGVVVPDKNLAVGLTPVLLIPMSLFTGFLVNRGQIVWYLLPLHYVSIYTYGFTAIVLNEFDDNDEVDCIHLNRTDPGFCDPIGNLDPELDRLDCIGILGMFILVFYFLAYVLLKMNSKKFEDN